MQKKLITSLFLLLILLITSSAFSQQQDFIRGQLLDGKTQEPVAFASIRIKGRALGIISNTDGSFKIPSIYKEYGDIIEISSMGYDTKEILISELLFEKINVVKLTPGVLELQEAVVQAKHKKSRLSAKKIVRKAIEAISENYPTTSFSTVGYYRDYQLKDNEYINLNEAILEVFDKGFDQLDNVNTKVKIYDYKKNEDFNRDDEADNEYKYKSRRKVINKAYLFDYGGNEFTILRVHDAIRNYKVNSYDFINNIEVDLFDSHNFYKEDDTYTENEALYTIKIMIGGRSYRAYGKFYISKKDFAIHKMEYAVYNNAKENISQVVNKHNNKKQLIFEVTTEYKRKYNKMYLNYISFQNSFQVRLPPKFIVDSIVVNAPKGYYLLCFNKPVDEESASKLKNYKVSYGKEKFEVKRLKVFKDSVRVYPEMSARALSNSMREIATNNRNGIVVTSEQIDVRVKKIKDVDGNVVNKMGIGNYQQFREFFAQQVKPNSTVPLNSLFMDKRKPIFQNQPMVKPDNFEDYWMNTPLQNIND